MQTGWKDKLEQWAPEPPAAVWERLSEQLEEKPLFAEQLYAFSATPPAGVWQAIQKKMEPETITTPVIRMLPRNKWIRYGSVAASLLFAFFLFRLYHQSGTQTDVKSASPVENTFIGLPQLPNLQAATPPVNRSATGFAMASHPRAGTASYPPVPETIDEPIPQTQPVRYTSSRFQEVVPINYNLEDDQLERYIVVPVGEDAAVRVPKKLYELFRCGEVPPAAGCTEWMGQMRQRAASPRLVTTADFAGVLEMVQNVE